MAELTLQPEAVPEEMPKRRSSSGLRVIRYVLLRILTLFVTVVVGIYLTVLIANMGGYVDEIQRAQIREDVQQRALNDAGFKLLSVDERNARIAQTVALREKRMGLDQPFAIRSFRFLSNALTLNLGWTQNMTSDSGSKQVRNIMLERLPTTLLLFASSNILLFFASVFEAVCTGAVF